MRTTKNISITLPKDSDFLFNLRDFLDPIVKQSSRKSRITTLRASLWDSPHI